MKVLTIDGLIDREQLTVKDIVQEEGNSRVTATEWFHGDRLVRRDVHVNVLAGFEMGADI